MSGRYGRPSGLGTSGSAAGPLPAGGTPRDRVLDLAKGYALLVVVMAHALARDVSTGEPANVLDLRPELRWITWILQVLPLFFAAGAVSNRDSWQRSADAAAYVRRRISRLAAPAVVYASVWTALLLPLALHFTPVELVGRYLAQLLWFLGVYSMIVIAVPVTTRWASRPLLTLGLGLVTVLAVDVIRWQVEPLVGWLNWLLVWGWLHQLGYCLPTLRRQPAVRLLLAAAGALAVAFGLAVFGPYSTSMVSMANDEELSNLSPPTIVLACFGLAQVLLLAALWPLLDRLLTRQQAWVVVAAWGSRAIEVYLWHVPLVAVVIGMAWVIPIRPAPLGPAWWLLHVTVAVLVLTAAWLLAGPMARAARWLRAHTEPRRPMPVPPVLAGVVTAMVIVALSQTGFATWLGDGLLGMPSSSLLLLLLLGGWRAVAAVGATHDTVGSAGVVRADQAGGTLVIGHDGADAPGQHVP